MERYFPSNYPFVCLWGIAVLLGMIGLGRLVARAVGGEAAKNAGWGLHAVWGMGLYLFAGGLLALFGACGEMAITLLIGVGLAAMAWTTYRDGLPKRVDLAALPWAMWPAFAVVAFFYAGGICWQGNVNEADDLPAYYNFCEKLLSTGSFADPFSWRRLASLGGHTLLQCSILTHASYANAQAFEMALCPVILLGLMLGFRGGILKRAQLGSFIALLVVTTPILRVNTASSFTGIILALGLFSTLDLAERADASRLRVLAVAGFVGAGLCSLRPQYVPSAFGTLGLFWVGSWIQDRRVFRAAIVEAGYWGGALFVALLPWMIGEFLSNGSPLFPLFQGDNNLSFNPQAVGGPLYFRLGLPALMIFTPILAPLLLCLLAGPDLRRSLPSRALSIAAVLGSLALAYGINLAPDIVTVPRYVQPILLPAAFAALMTAVVSARSRVIALAFAVILVATSMPERCQTLMNYYRSMADADKLRIPVDAKTISIYRHAQLLVPEGKKILVCGDFPFLFDHQRNPIWIIDLPNAASPAPGLPFQRAPEEMKRYLRHLGVEYVIFVNFDQALELYNRANWMNHLRGDVPLFRIQAPYYLDFFYTIDRLAASETILGQKEKLTVMQFKP